MKYLRTALRALKNAIGDTNYLKIRRATVVGLKPAKRFAARGRKAALRALKMDSNGVGVDALVNYSKWTKAADGRALEGTTVDFSELELNGVTGLSIVTLNLNSAHFIEKYLDGLLHLPAIPVELIFIDHNSSDKCVELVEGYRDRLPFEVRVIRKKANDRYSVSNNEGIAEAKFDYVLMLNNDVVLTESSRVDVALRLLRERSQIGLIGWNLYYGRDYKFRQHQGIGFQWDKTDLFYRPANIAGLPKRVEFGRVREFPSVTAAMLLARKMDLTAVGAFDPEYNYGFEDVDLCLRYTTQLDKKCVTVDGLNAVHEESTSQNRENKLSVAARRQKNARYFQHKFSTALGYVIRQSCYGGESFARLNRLKIGFVVTEAFPKATAGDYFTALELSLALQHELACDVEFFPQRGPDANKTFSCSGLDALIVMVDRYDIRELEDRTANTIVVAWMRNWFDRWQSWEYSGLYDYYLCSSEKAADFTFKQFGIPSQILRIGTNLSRFYADVERPRPIDICFVGSKWGVEREIETVFPALAKYNSKVVGHGWQDNGSGIFHAGIPYSEVAGLYADTKIVIDDAASSTKQWSSVNSRVFDALAAGCLVISNGRSGVEELSAASSGKLCIPTYESVDELENLLDKYLLDEALRLQTCRQLQNVVCEEHAYSNRANSFKGIAFNWLQQGLKIAIKVPVPSAIVKHEWGDYHFADSLRSALMRLGHQVRIDLLPDWETEATPFDEVVIVIRGLSKYSPQPSQVNIMWNISHPDKVSRDEYAEYDAVYVASNSYAKTLAESLPEVEVQPLLQCTDPYRFFPEVAETIPKHDVLFVGNSRRIYRDVVRFSVESNTQVAVYGGLWDELIDSSYIFGENIPNTELRKYYSNAGVVLNDHWESMREHGFISNRLFDAAACGSVVLTDTVIGMDGLFGPNIVCFDGTLEGFKESLARAKEAVVTNESIQDFVTDHSFDARAKVIADKAAKLLHEKMSAWQPLI